MHSGHFFKMNIRLFDLIAEVKLVIATMKKNGLHAHLYYILSYFLF